MDGSNVHLRKLLFRRHVRFGIGREVLVEPTFLRFPGHDHFAFVTAFEDCFRGIEFESALLLDRTVTFHAMRIENRLDLRGPHFRGSSANERLSRGGGDETTPKFDPILQR